MPENSNKTLLKNLVMDASGLEKLESMIVGFNLFEAIGMKSQEIKHSATLAFLLNPSKPHGFGDYFLRQIVKDITRQTDTNISSVDVDCADFSDAEVWCERKHIDILIVCKSAKLVIAIENKVYARESENQLKDYDEHVTLEEEWKEYNKLFVFLTIDGGAATGGSKNVNWIPYTHGKVTEVLEVSLQANKTNIGVDQEVLIRHYLELMRRHILPDSDIAILARQIYLKHKQALDLIIEYRPDSRKLIADELKGLISQNGFKSVASQKNIFRFIGNDWEFNEGWCGTKPGYVEHGVTFEINYWDMGKRLLKVELVRGNIPNPINRKTLDDELSGVLKVGEMNGDSGKEPENSSPIDYHRVWIIEEPIGGVSDLESDAFIEDLRGAWDNIVKDERLKKICGVATTAMKKAGAIK